MHIARDLLNCNLLAHVATEVLHGHPDLVRRKALKIGRRTGAGGGATTEGAAATGNLAPRRLVTKEPPEKKHQNHEPHH